MTTQNKTTENTPKTQRKHKNTKETNWP